MTVRALAGATAKVNRGPLETVAFEDFAIGLAAETAAWLFAVDTPTVWTANDDFAAADMVFENLAFSGGFGSLCVAHLQRLHQSREAA